MAEQFLAQGWLDFWMLHVNDHAVATEFGFRYGDTYSFLQGGFDPEYRSHGVGVALKGLILQELICDGLRWYDFLAGRNSQKERWGTQLRTYRYLSCARPWSRGALYLRGLRIARRTKAYVRTRLPAPAWSLLRRLYHQFVAQPNTAGTNQPWGQDVKDE